VAVEVAFKEARRVFIASLVSLFIGHPLKSLAFSLVENVPKKVGGREDILFKSLPVIGQKQPGGL
jgi:hypothetical protein